MTDFSFQDEGSLVILYPQSDKAREWVSLFVAVNDETQHWGDGVVIERRYVADILLGIHDAGLTLAEAGKI